VVVNEVALCITASLQSCAELVALLATNATLSEVVETNKIVVLSTAHHSCVLVLYALQSVHIFYLWFRVAVHCKSRVEIRQSNML